MPDDRVATSLDRIRADIAERDASIRADWGNPATVADFNAAQDKLAARVPPLLAAIEAVLKPHQPGPVTIFGSLCKRHENHRHFSITATEAEDVQSCPECEAAVYTSCAGCHPAPLDYCQVRSAISAALLGPQQGEETGGG